VDGGAQFSAILQTAASISDNTWSGADPEPQSRSLPNMNRSIRSSSSVLALSAAACLAVCAGCYAPGGSGFSTDTHSYVSTSWQPYTITLKDTRTGQNFWSIDVPVGKKLVVHFREGEGIKGSATPDLM
jgi:hypothetical protein